MGCCARDGEDCVDRCEECCPCIGGYHTLWTVFGLLVLGFISSLTLGLYTFLSVRGSVFQFAWSFPWRLYVESSALAFVVAGLFLLCAVGIWIVFRNECAGVAYKVFYVLLLLAAVCAALVASVGPMFVVVGANQASGSFRNDLEEVWMDVVKDSNSTLACEIQSKLKCQGFDEGDCVRKDGKNVDRCATRCTEKDAEAGLPRFDGVTYPGCGDRIASFYSRWYIALLVGTFIAALAGIVALFVSLCGISFVLRKA